MTDLTIDTLTKLRAEMDRIHRETWERTQAEARQSPGQLLRKRLSTYRAHREPDPSVARQLHLSLAREAVRKAVQWYRQAREDAWTLSQDQLDMIRDWASDAKIEARAHIAAALR